MSWRNRNRDSFSDGGHWSRSGRDTFRPRSRREAADLVSYDQAPRKAGALTRITDKIRGRR